MILVADSGSTKTSWATIDGSVISDVIQTVGINPVRDSEEIIAKVISEEVITQIISVVRNYTQRSFTHIYFYGAGCIQPYSDAVKRQLKVVFPESEIYVESDMLGAAVALCGHSEGIACILGTGANSCLFDGEKIVDQTPALGFILGDEGSGAVMGKRLVSDIFKRQLPEHIIQAFSREMGFTQTDVIDRVYRKPQPNLFLSSLVPFLQRHLDDASIADLVKDEFRRFLQRNIRNYNRPDLPVNFVGGITNSFYEQLQEAVTEEGMIMGRVIQKPIEEIAKYHFLDNL